MDLSKKTVDIFNKDMLKIMFPSYITVDKVSALDTGKNAIYVGKIIPGLSTILDRTYASWVNTAGSPDVDLSTPKLFLEYYYKSVGRNVPQYVLDMAETLGEEDVFNYIKTLYVSGVWPVKQETTDVTIFDLYKAIPGSTTELIKTYMKLTQIYPFRVLESSVLTFLQRVKDPSNQQVSAYYSRIIKSANVKVYPRLKPCIANYCMKSNNYMSLLMLLLDLRG